MHQNSGLRGVLGFLGALALALSGCGKPDRPGYIDEGPSSRGGTASAPLPSDGGDTAAPSSSGGTDDGAAIVPEIPDVYLFGPLRDVFHYAAAPVTHPDQYVYGFEQAEMTATIRNDQIIYTWGRREVRQFANVFVPDLDGSPAFDANTIWPENTLDNDVPVAMPECEATDVRDWIVGSTGRFLYYCANFAKDTWLEDGVPLPNASFFLEALAEDDIGWARSEEMHGIVNIATGEYFAVPQILGDDGLPRGYMERAHGAGFHVLLVLGRTPDGIPDQLLEVDGEGHATELGSYPALPSHVRSVRIMALASDDSQLQIVQLDDDRWALLRQTLNGENQIIHTQTQKSALMLQDSLFFTAP
jgi:hypothetical protein